jgi:hypothetical protein
MERRLRREEVMTIEVLRERGVSGRAIARQPGIHETAVRYRLKRLATQARDRRADQVSSVAPLSAAVAHWMERGSAGGMNGQALYEWFAAEHGYAGSYKAVQRFVRAHYPLPRLRVGGDGGHHLLQREREARRDEADRRGQATGVVETRSKPPR